MNLNPGHVIRKWLLEAGADRVGFTDASPVDPEIAARFEEWLSAGCHAGMSYLWRNRELRRDPASLLDGARSVVCVAFGYGRGDKRSQALENISSYALCDDYHDALRAVLGPVAERIEKEFGCKSRICIDSAPLAERILALRAGLGRAGRNGSVIIDGLGSRFFLCEILLTLELESDSPSSLVCDGCDACLRACPGQAIGENGMIDARRCLSYLTIEHRGAWDSAQLALMDTKAGRNTLFGCDICQNVCPHNSAARLDSRSQVSSLRPRPEMLSLTAADCLSLDGVEFSRLFKGSPVKRAKLGGLIRNALNCRADSGPRPVGRFAPSPTGRMHLGNIFTALMSWLSVRSRAGRWILRIEDLDPQRSKPEYASMIEDDLRWLGLDWDEGGSMGGPSAPYFQSQRNDRYESALEKLCGSGLVYDCYCTRADIMATQAPHQSDGRVVYAGTCRPSRLGGNFVPGDSVRDPAKRLWVPDKEIVFEDLVFGQQSVNLASHCGDFIVRRGDGAWAYQLAVVVDDAEMGVTEVVRGNDLLLSSAQQICLYSLLGAKAPAYLHLPLLCDTQGRRLSKRNKDLDMESIRRSLTPERVVGILAWLGGIVATPAPRTAASLVGEFRLRRREILSGLKKETINVSARIFTE